MAYAEVKWPHLAPHSRAIPADALATVTPLLMRQAGCKPPASRLRASSYGYAFNPQRRSRIPDRVTVSTLAWVEQASLPVSRLSDPHIIRAALDGLCTRLDGSPAAANTISRKRAVFNGALGYAVELGLLPANTVERFSGARLGPPSRSARPPSPARHRCGRSWPRSGASGRNWPPPSWPAARTTCGTPTCRYG